MAPVTLYLENISAEAIMTRHLRSSPYAVKLAALLVLVLCFGATTFAWFLSRAEAHHKIQARFDQSAALVKSRIEQRMAAYQSILQGARGLFAASQRVDRAEWQAYVASLQLTATYPGIQGIGYAEYFVAAELDTHLNQIRAEGYPDYNLRPTTPRDEYTSIIYLEPFDWRNQRAFGFDMLTEPTRRHAMSTARDTGQPTISARVKLLQETNEAPQAGALLYIPVYRNGAAIDTVDARRAALQGYVYAPFRMNDLIDSIFRTTRTRVDIDFALYSGNDIDEAQKLYQTSALRLDAPPRYIDLLSIRHANNQWLIQAYSNPAFEAMAERNEPLLILVGGGVGSLLLFGIIWSLGDSRERAIRLADQITAQLRNSERRLRKLFDATPNGLVMVDANGIIQQVNSPLCHMLGYTHDELIGQNIDRLVPTRYAHQHKANRDRYFANPQTRTMGARNDLSALRKDGTELSVEIGLNPLTTSDGIFVIASLIDITERKAVERLKGEFVSVVSHELRTPLTAILGSLGLVQQGLAGALTHEAQNLINLAHENSQRLLNLINDILDIEKLTSGKYHMLRKRHELQDILQHAITLNQPYGEKFGVQFVLSETPEPHIVQVDRERLTQVFTNLLSNAAKFSPHGGTVRIDIVPHGEWVRANVSDAGPGIPEAFRDRIFQRFTQADGSDSRAKGGTGLGLAICKSIVEQLGGRISFTSHIGQGTTFHVDLPQTPPESDPNATYDTKTDI
jgi:PAS domain S-box-containing protein